MKRAALEAEIRAAYEIGGRGSILAIDPDAHTPGAALWLDIPETREDASCWVWGGRKDGEPLASAGPARRVLRALAPSLVLIEGALRSGGPFAGDMAGQNQVRGGLAWICALEFIPCVIVPPENWQPAYCGSTKGYGSRKARYKALACEAMDVARVNEDAAAALGILSFALDALGIARPSGIVYAAPPGAA